MGSRQLCGESVFLPGGTGKTVRDPRQTLPPSPARLVHLRQELQHWGLLSLASSQAKDGNSKVCSQKFQVFLSWNNEVIPTLVSRLEGMSHAEQHRLLFPQQCIFPSRGDSRQSPRPWLSLGPESFVSTCCTVCRPKPETVERLLPASSLNSPAS